MVYDGGWMDGWSIASIGSSFNHGPRLPAFVFIIIIILNVLLESVGRCVVVAVILDGVFRNANWKSPTLQSSI